MAEHSNSRNGSATVRRSALYAVIAGAGVILLGIVLLWAQSDAVVVKNEKNDSTSVAATDNLDAPSLYEIESPKEKRLGEKAGEYKLDVAAPDSRENHRDGIELLPSHSEPISPSKDESEPTGERPKTNPETGENPKVEVEVMTPAPHAEPLRKVARRDVRSNKPFVNFAKAVALPELTEGTTAATPKMVVGTLAETVDIQINLLGGDEGVPGKPKFELVPAGEAWTINLLDGANAEGKPVKVADIFYSKETGEVMFRWADAAETHRESNFLRNCILNLRSGTHQVHLSLRKPTECQPFVILIDKPKMMAKLTVPYLPEPKLVQVELTTLEGNFPPHIFDPGPAMTANKGIAKIRLGRVEQFLILEITSRMARTIDLQMTPTVQFPGQDKAAPLMLGKSEGFLHQAMAASEQLTKAVAAGANIPVADVNGRSKLEKLTRNLADIDRAIPQLQAFDTDCKSLKDGRVHLRVIYKIDEHTVELANSEQGLAGAAGGTSASIFDKVK